MAARSIICENVNVNGNYENLIYRPNGETSVIRKHGNADKNLDNISAGSSMDIIQSKADTETIQEDREIFDASPIVIITSDNSNYFMTEYNVQDTEFPLTDSDVRQQVREAHLQVIEKKLVCRRKTKEGDCDCINKYLHDGKNNVTSTQSCEKVRERSVHLTSLAYKAEILSRETVSKKGDGESSGYRTKEYEDFVLSNRSYLRNELKLCEKACQLVLDYSNNFLHKRLKSRPDKLSRIEHKKQLVVLSQLNQVICCQKRCTMLAVTHSALLNYWREEAAKSKGRLRQVIAQMLIPAAGNNRNCYNFIRLVTGCSSCTIAIVSERMKEAGGLYKPTEHGLSGKTKHKMQESSSSNPS